MRWLLSIFFAFSLLMTSAVGGAVSLPTNCPPKACCCAGEEPCCPPEAVPQTSCGQDQTPSPANCGRGQAPIQAAQLPQVPDEVEAVKAIGDPYAHPWPAVVEQAMSIFAATKTSGFTRAVDGVPDRVPDRLSKLRILRI
ncbi:MAG: hypothetical protein IPP78_07675 [Holophagaceae bacterium]|nr:hypothetical protein [Holophagaceae bacterium]